MCMIKETCIWSCLNIAFTDMYSNFLVFVFFSSIPIFKINRLYSNYLYGCIRESEISTNDGTYFSIYIDLALYYHVMNFYLLWFFSQFLFFIIVRLFLLTCTIDKIVSFFFSSQMLLLLIIEHLHMVPYNIKIDSCSTKKD